MFLGIPKANIKAALIEGTNLSKHFALSSLIPTIGCFEVKASSSSNLTMECTSPNLRPLMPPKQIFWQDISLPLLQLLEAETGICKCEHWQ